MSLNADIEIIHNHSISLSPSSIENVVQKTLDDLRQNFIKTIHYTAQGFQCNWVAFYSFLLLLGMDQGNLRMIQFFHSTSSFSRNCLFLKESCNDPKGLISSPESIYKKIDRILDCLAWENFYHSVKAREIELDYSFRTPERAPKALARFLIKYCIYLTLNYISSSARSYPNYSGSVAEKFVTLFDAKKPILDECFTQTIEFLKNKSTNFSWLACCNGKPREEMCKICYSAIPSAVTCGLPVLGIVGTLAALGIRGLTIVDGGIAFGMATAGGVCIGAMIRFYIYNSLSHFNPNLLPSSAIFPNTRPVTQETNFATADETTPLLPSPILGAASAQQQTATDHNTQDFVLCAECSKVIIVISAPRETSLPLDPRGNIVILNRNNLLDYTMPQNFNSNALCCSTICRRKQLEKKIRETPMNYYYNCCYSQCLQPGITSPVPLTSACCQEPSHTMHPECYKQYVNNYFKEVFESSARRTFIQCPVPRCTAELNPNLKEICQDLLTGLSAAQS